MSLNNNHHQNNNGNRYFAQNNYNPSALNLLQTTPSLTGGGSYNLLANAQGQAGGYALTGLNQAGYPSHFALNQQSSMPQLNHHQTNSMLPNTQPIPPNGNLILSSQHSRNYRHVPPLPGQVQYSQNTMGAVLKNQPVNIQKRRNEVEIQGIIDNIPLSQKKIKTDNTFSLSDVSMLIEPENRQPMSYKIYELSQYEISKEIDDKIAQTKKILEDAPKIKPNYMSLQCCETAKLQVDLFHENAEQKNQKKVYCLVEDLQRLMNVLKLDKENEAKLNEKSSNVHSKSHKESKKKGESDKKGIKKAGRGRRKKIVEESENDKSENDEDEDNEESQSREQSDNYSHSQSQSAFSKKKATTKTRILKKKRVLNKRAKEDREEESDYNISEDSFSNSQNDDEDDEEEQSVDDDQIEHESSQQPVKTKKRILRRKKSLVSDESSGAFQEEGMQEEISTSEKHKNTNNQDDSGEKFKNKRGRRLLQKNRLTQGKNKNAIESDDDEEESLSKNKKQKGEGEESAEIDNIKLVRKQPKNKLQIDDDEEKIEQPLKVVGENAKNASKLPSPIKLKLEHDTKIEVEEESQSKIELQKLDTEIKIEEKIEHNDAKQEIKTELDVKIENKLLKLKEREQIINMRSQELEKRQKYLQDQQQKLLLLNLHYSVSIIDQKNAAVNLDIVNKHISIF